MKKIVIAIVVVAMAALMIADAKLGESECGVGNYDQSIGVCK